MAEKPLPAGGKSLISRQIATVVLLFGGYAALYFCRADLSVATPLLVRELGRRGVSPNAALVRIGYLSSYGVLAYALGKLFLTGLGDYWGGRVNFLIGLAGATAFTLMFALGGALPIFTLAWLGNRLTQSVAWAGLLKVSSRWFDYSSHGAIIGILSVSYLIGDAVARRSMGALLAAGYGWRSLFYFAAAVAGVLFAANFWLLRESRTASGHREAQPHPLNLFADAQHRPASIGALLSPLLRSRAYQLVCLLSFGCTIIRETFNNWTPMYLHDTLGFSTASAANMSAIFPGVGVVSVLVTGWLSDRVGANGRSLLLCVGLTATVAALVALMMLRPGTGAALPLAAIGTIAFCLLGPYSYLGGAFALDFGGKQAAAMSSGIIDGVGYLGAVFAGGSVAKIAVSLGWKGVFAALAGVCALTALGAGALYLHGARTQAQGRRS